MNLTELNEDNFFLFAIQNHDNPEASTIEDFKEDLLLFKKLKRSLKKFLTTNKKEKFDLCINYIIHIYNVFGEASLILLFYSLENEYYPFLKTFLVCLDKMPENIDPKIESIPLDPVIKKYFKKI